MRPVACLEPRRSVRFRRPDAPVWLAVRRRPSVRLPLVEIHDAIQAGKSRILHGDGLRPAPVIVFVAGIAEFGDAYRLGERRDAIISGLQDLAERPVMAISVMVIGLKTERPISSAEASLASARLGRDDEVIEAR
ncbi:hypothetical protein [Labrys monachus]|uniref:Uncharacterized protein n=1 Tax=Labrys monachus TaxID=217067 RepID=A0ABU0FA53_9HYPH|nr:hypothetical protein [Labrys monachus]MDQ0391493.1 hypothetical protein [Labrys monachus]